MSDFIEYKIRAKTTWTGGQSFKVVKRICRAVKPVELVNEEVKFTGSITECESYLKLMDSDNILE